MHYLIKYTTDPAQIQLLESIEIIDQIQTVTRIVVYAAMLAFYMLAVGKIIRSTKSSCNES